MTDLVLIADDLTGAADAGVPFAAAGFATAIAFDIACREEADVLALSTESRDVPPAEAERRVRTALSAVFGRDGVYRPAWIYKKMDSALRGHPAEELAVTMRLARIGRALIAPAIPSQGRTTVGGIQYDCGVRLAESQIGRERGSDDLVALFQRSARSPVRSIGLAAVRGAPSELRNALTQPGSWIAVADAETDEDLERLAEVAIAAGIRLFSGAAGLSGVLAQRLPIHQIHRPPTVQRSGGPVLVVAGSRHETTTRQIEAAERAGAVEIRLDQAALDEAQPGLATITSRVCRELAQGHATILTTAGLEPSTLGGEVVATRLATIASDPEVLAIVGALVLTGGDVATAVCRAIGVRTIWLRGEVLPAIPWATLTGPGIEGLPVVTKAGSFGPPEAIRMAIDHLERINCRTG